jgi:hypothetical protein
MYASPVMAYRATFPIIMFSSGLNVAVGGTLIINLALRVLSLNNHYNFHEF